MGFEDTVREALDEIPPELAACDKAGIVLGIGHERRFEPAMEHVLQVIASGRLGQILHLEANVSHNLFARLDGSNWRVNATDAPAGAIPF